MILQYCLAWFPIIVIAFANGALRELGYKPYAGELLAHQISCFTLIAFFALYLGFVSRRWRIPSLKEAWIIGAMWLFMTIAFEFGFGHFVSGNPWSTLLHDYNVLEGRLWTLVLLSILTGPYISFLAHKRRETPAP